MVLQQIASTSLLIIFIFCATFYFPISTSQRITNNTSEIQWRCNTSDTPPSTRFRSYLRTELLQLRATLRSVSSNYLIGTTTKFKAILYTYYHCRGDVNSTSCHDCVSGAIEAAQTHCFNSSTEVAVWGDVCLFRYSSEPLYGQRDESPWTIMYNETVSIPASVNMTRFDEAINSIVDVIATRLRMIDVNYATYEVNVSSDSTIFVMGECTTILFPQECAICVHECASRLISISEGGLKVGGRALFLSCSFRYEMYRFYGDYNKAYRSRATQDGSPPRRNPRGSMVPEALTSGHNSTGSLGSKKGGWKDDDVKRKPSRNEDAAGIGVSLAVILLLISGALFFAHRRKKNKQASQYMEDITSADSLQFEFSKIRSATHNFAADKKLGQGGFGEVFKGKLANGQQIAVKRLSKDSKQGIAEFKTEILLVANLQHRNLVKLLGFCFSGKEKILVYEYLANSSLDRILFDPTKREALNWETRFNIISGIAKGLLYLHEDSRLKIIHRDLKTSNILLDDFMIPKISDFGMAKLFEVDQTRDATRTIVGTYGYMAPEYMLTGQYSVKSDIYSFGIIVLEMVTGLRNTYMSRPLLEEALLHRAWRVWNEGSALELVDYVLGDEYSREEVIKCIHIGLLCIQEEASRRPQMTWVVAAIRDETNHFPAPTPPNFFDSIRRSASGSCSSTDQLGATSSTGGEIMTDLEAR